jgi:hypothetical protein
LSKGLSCELPSLNNVTPEGRSTPTQLNSPLEPLLHVLVFGEAAHVRVHHAPQVVVARPADRDHSRGCREGSGRAIGLVLLRRPYFGRPYLHTPYLRAPAGMVCRTLHVNKAYPGMEWLEPLAARATKRERRRGYAAYLARAHGRPFFKIVENRPSRMYKRFHLLYIAKEYNVARL